MTVTAYKSADDRARVLTAATLLAANALGLATKDLADIIDLPNAVVLQMDDDAYLLEEGSTSFERAAHFVRFFLSLDALTDGQENIAQTWIRNANQSLNGVPLDIIKTRSGMVSARAYLDSGCAAA